MTAMPPTSWRARPFGAVASRHWIANARPAPAAFPF